MGVRWKGPNLGAPHEQDKFLPTESRLFRDEEIVIGVGRWWAACPHLRSPNFQLRASTLPMLHVLDHPLAVHAITHLRDETTKPATFRTLAYQIGLLLAVEAETAPAEAVESSAAESAEADAASTEA